MRRRLMETAAEPRLVDPLTLLASRLAEVAREEEHAASREMTYEVHLDPPAGAQVARLTVAGQYRAPVPIMFDYGTRTAYPMRNDR